MNYPFSDSLNLLSKVLQKLPGIGPKSALRLSMFLLNAPDKSIANLLADNLSVAIKNTNKCQFCRILSDEKLCNICNSKTRDKNILCIVETAFDALAIEDTGCYQGRYFVLLGKLSPIDGIGPEEIGVNLLASHLKSAEITEIIIATSYTIEGEVTANYISSLAANYNIKVSRIAEGVPVGGELEYLDGATLMRALNRRKEVCPENL